MLLSPARAVAKYLVCSLIAVNFFVTGASFGRPVAEQSVVTAESEKVNECSVRLTKARQLGDKGRYREAIDQLSGAIRLRPQDAILYEFRCFFYMRVFEYEKGIADATKCISLNPHSIHSYRNRSLAYEKLGRIELAQKDLLMVDKLSRSLAVEDILSRGISCMMQRDSRGAMVHFNKAVELYPKDPRPYFERGRALSAVEDPEKAIMDFEKAAQLGKGQIAFDSLYQAGQCHLQQQRPERAIYDLTKALRIQPNHGHAHWARAQAYATVGEYQKAIDESTNCAKELDVVRLDVTKKGSRYQREGIVMMAGSYEFRGDCFDKLKQYEKAVEEYTKAIQVNPGNDEAYIARARDFMKLNKYQNAIDDCTTLIKKNPKDEEAFQIRGDALYGLKQYERAAADYTIAIKLDPQDSWRVLGARAEAYRKLGRDDLARLDLQRAKDMGFPVHGNK